MLLMVTNRRQTGGDYGDEEQSRYGYHYLHAYANNDPGSDGFDKKGKNGFKSRLLGELTRLKTEQGIGTPKVGLYVHGYNNNWQESIDELVDLHGSLAKEMGYEPVLVGFSWPSSGATINYLADREEARDSVPAFARLLGDIHEFLLANERNCFATSYCIAHSMGNYLLRKGMEYLSDHLGTPVGRTMFNETIMLAPDLASKDIESDGKGRYIADFSRRVHVYYSKHDRALKASSIKRFGGNRLGRHGVNDYSNLPSNVIIVDAGTYANSESADGLKDRRGEQVSVHSSHRYHPKILADVVQVLSSIDRSLIASRNAVPGESEFLGESPNHFELS